MVDLLLRFLVAAIAAALSNWVYINRLYRIMRAIASRLTSSTFIPISNKLDFVTAAKAITTRPAAI